MPDAHLELRAPTLDELPVLADFFSSLYDAYGAFGGSENDIRDVFANPAFDPVSDFRVATHAGAIVGWTDLWDQNKGHERFFLDLHVHPRDPAVYAALLDWGTECARRLAKGDAPVLRASADSEEGVLAEELTLRGFCFIRHFFRMEADLSEEPPEPSWPEGISVRTFVPGDARAVFDADNDAFADHWDFTPVAFDEWRAFMVESSQFDPTLWFLAEDGGEIAGFSLCRSERRPGIGHVNVLGVRPPWRRRGLARALLLHSFRELRRRGRAQADLGVDGDNTTGAVRLYESVGMRVVRRRDAYELSLA